MWRTNRREMVKAAVFGLAAARGIRLPAAAAPAPRKEKSMEVLTAFDGGVAQPFQVEGDTITFTLRPGQKILNVLLRQAPAPLRVRALLDESVAKMLTAQGLVVSTDGETFAAVPLTKVEDGTWEAVVHPRDGELRLATRYPYGRDGLERLLCETGRAPGGSWRVLRDGHRGTPLFGLGEDDGRKRVHYFVAGEDAWETAGCFVADAMVRLLATDAALARRVGDKGLVRIVPLVSPYSATRESGSYTTVEGKGIYGAATWAQNAPPPEYSLVRAMVEESIRQKRLGLLLTMHSWQGQNPSSGLETIRSSGENRLAGEREVWAKRALETLIAGVPHGKTAFPERIWHPGLARDYLLARHNAITFRVEVTTENQGLDGFRETARAFLENLARVDDWGPVLPA